MPAIKGQVRRSQLVTTYGVGAVVALGDESFMVAGIDRWPTGDPDLHEPRLERRLGVLGFRQPPAREGRPDVPVVRYPRWHSCPKCHRLATHMTLAGAFDSNTCALCARTLVPSRFVVVCGKGHISDFPYMRWVHEGKPAEGIGHELYIEAVGATAGLRDIRISCSCNKSRTMDGAFDRNAFQRIASCRGERPWLQAPAEDCGTAIRALQRGASNVWFGALRSAISIPPWSEAAFQLLNAHWSILRAIPDNAVRGTIENLQLAREGFSVDDLVQAVADRKALEIGETEQTTVSEEEFRRQEFDALSRGQPETSSQQQFVAVQGEMPADLRSWFSTVMKVKRLREVRALQGFTRLLPAGLGSDVAPLSVEPEPWLPAIEVKGEGIFLVFDEDRLTTWQNTPRVVERAALINARYVERAKAWGHQVDRTITPRLVAVHTFAHALINQLSLEAGYPAASLRERLFVFEDAAGVLVYTATTDSAGSLGGLIAQAEPDRLAGSVREAIGRYSWCSSDPVCIETTAAGADALNLAACHACALLPETSCEEMNELLDRAHLVGTPEHANIGLFSEFLIEG
jgi:hypothetical protein